MLDKKYIGRVREDLLSYAVKRREVIKKANDAQHLAKKAIFAMQRDNQEEGENYLQTSLQLIVEINKTYKQDASIFDEGCYKAAVEEFVEAAIFNQYLTKKIIGKIAGVPVDSDGYIGGLCDVPGELLRYAIKSATERKFDEVKKCHAAAEEIIGELVDMDLTGYNRQKFDQAKQALHKLEQVLYEVSLRQ